MGIKSYYWDCLIVVRRKVMDLVVKFLEVNNYACKEIEEMENQKECYIGSPAGIVFCVNGYKEGKTTGYFYHAYSQDGVEVTSMEGLLFSMERLFDEIGFPFPGTNQRTFKKEKEIKSRKERVIKVMKDEELLKKHGDMGTFIIRVQHRQNSSWQGLVTWAEENKTVSFRSALELIKIIDEVIASDDDKDTESLIE